MIRLGTPINSFLMFNLEAGCQEGRGLALAMCAMGSPEIQGPSTNTKFYGYLDEYSKLLSIYLCVPRCLN